MNRLDLALEAKTLDESGLIEGIAAGYGDVDLGDDRIMPGALTKSITGRASLPMLLFHNMERPVGRWDEMVETDAGLKVKGRFAMTTAGGKEAHALTREGALAGLSIGWSRVKDRMVGKVRELVEIKVHEISLVAVPMHERARITSVKSALDEGRLPTLPEFEDHLREACGFSRSQAKAIAAHGLKHLLSQREAGREVDEQAAFLSALLKTG